MNYHPPLRDPVAVPTAHVTVPVSVPDPSDAAADGAFGGVKPKAQKDHRAGYGRPFEELLDWARKPADLRSSDVARLVAEIDSLRAEIAERERSLRMDPRLGHTELTDIIAHARKGYDVRGSQAALLVGWIDMVTLRAEIAEAERDSLRHVLALLKQPSDAVFGAASVDGDGTADMIRRAVAAAEREAGR